MNERIRELAEQANANELSYAYYRGEKKPENAVTLHSVDLELFAELIVQECYDTIKKDMELAHIQLIPLTFDIYANGRLRRIIKEHFGVEE